MTNLIEALRIFCKYRDVQWPISCERATLYISDITKDEVSPEDRERLVELNFFWSDLLSSWLSYYYG